MRADRFVVVDVEATCWGSDRERGMKPQEIIEIGFCVVGRNPLEILHGGTFLSKPEHALSRFCTELTTLTDAALENAPPFSEAVRQFRSATDSDRYIWGSWGDFDRRLFQTECKRLHVPYPFSPRHVNIKAAAALAFGWSKEYGVETALKKLGLEFEGRPHRGLDDAVNITRIWSEVCRGARGRTG